MIEIVPVVVALVAVVIVINGSTDGLSGGCSCNSGSHGEDGRSSQCPLSTMECSQQAAWTSNRSLFVVFRVKAFQGRPTNSGLTLPRAMHLEGGVIECH